MGKLTAKILRPKSKKKVPLAVIPHNEPVCVGVGVKSKRHQFLAHSEGKKMHLCEVPVLELTTTKMNSRTEASRSLNENEECLTRQKRARSTYPPPLQGFRGDGEGSRAEGSIAGSQSSTPIGLCKEEGYLPDDNKTVKNLHIPGTADSCSTSGDGKQSGALVLEAVEERQPDCPECFDERRPVACTSREENMVSAELAAGPGSKAADVQTVQSSAEESGRRLSSRIKTAPTKTYRRRASRKGTTSSVPNPREQSCSSDQDGINWADFCKSDGLQETVARATDTLQDAYDKLYRKYQNLKTRQLAEAAEAFDEQATRIKVFSTAADDLVQNLRITNSVRDQEEMMNRSTAMEVAYIECQNDLVIERARNLELWQRLENAQLRGSKLLHDLLENTTELTISSYGKSEIMFSHNQTGYEFKLEQNELSEEVGSTNALLYNVVSPGTILHVAPEWMQSEIVFDMTQALVFFRRLAVALRRGVSV